MDMIIDRI